MKNFLEGENLPKPPKIGEIVEGKVIAKESGRLFLNLEPIGTGMIYGREFYEAKEKIKDLKIGDSLFVKIINLENEQGYIELSLNQAGVELSLEVLRQKKEKGEKISAKILGANRGGLIAEVMGVQAFLPTSQLLPEHYPRVEKGDTTQIVKELQKFIGKELEVKILDVSQKGEQVILSEKAKDSEKIKEILKNYRVGDLVEGKITGLTDFGAFFRFDPENLEGLIHISELDWKIIENPAEVVKVGDILKTKIIDISGDKVFFSLKALKKDPWQEIGKKYKKGDIVSGKVTKLNPFGAFVQLTPEIQGLCHISEFGDRTKMKEELKVGEKYNFQILEIKPEEHRMSLKLVKK